MYKHKIGIGMSENRASKDKKDEKEEKRIELLSYQ